MKIVMFGHKHIPSREGGVEVVAEQLSTRLAALGHSVICLNRAGGSHTAPEYEGVRLKTVPTWNRKGLAAVTSSFFAAVYSGFSDADVVHIHAEGPAFFCWLPKLFGKRAVVTVHGLDWQRQKWGNGPGAKYIRAGERMAVRFADEIIVLSRNVQRYFLETYGRATRYIPNGISRPECRDPGLIGQYGLEKDGYLLFLGRLVPEKGVHLLLEAFSRLKTPKKLVIAGGSSDTDAYAAQLAAMAGRNVIFTGSVRGRLLEELYSNAYLYVLPSNLEGMPLSLLEAMSYGNCCVVSDIPECTEVVQDKGVTFPKGDAAALRSCLQRLCDAPWEVKKYKESARNFLCGKYDWDDVAEKTLELYQ